jgi:hypothetical protein
VDPAEDSPFRKIEGVPPEHWWPGLFLAALALRLLWLWAWERCGLTQRFGYDPYAAIARFWLGGPHWLDATHPPLFPMWIALLFRSLGRDSLLAVQLFNTLFGSAACCLLGLWTSRAVSPRAGRLAGLWAAFDPLLIFFSVQAQSEPFFILWELLLFLALQRAGNPPSAASAFLAGLLGGLASLARSVLGLFPPFLLVALAWPIRRDPRVRLWALLLAGWAVLPCAWGLRNLHRHGRFIPLAVNGGWNLWEGFTLDREEVRRRPLEMTREVSEAGIDPGDAIRSAEYFSRKTRRFLLEHPLESARIIAGKFWLYWRPWPYDPHDPRVRSLMAVYFSALFLLAGAGIWDLRRRPEVWPALALIVYLSLLHSVFFTSLRYRSPLEPFLCAFAAAGTLKFLGRGR